MSIRVLIVDDQALSRQGLRGALHPESDIEIVGEAEDGRSALEQALSLQPDVVLMDLMRPGGGGIEVTSAIKQKCPRTQIFILTVYPDPYLFRRAAAAGAVGYVLKDISPANLASGIRAVHNGKTMINPAIARRLVEDLFAGNGAAWSSPGHQHGLTQREIDVLAGVAKGLSDKEIASRLFLSESTVKTHLRAVYHKLKLRNRAQAAAFMVDKGLLQGSQ